MNRPTRSFSIEVDVTNPGQFFACCGLLELAHRLWPGAEGWFESGCFSIAARETSRPSLREIIAALPGCFEKADAGADDMTCPLNLHPRDGRSVRLDWWRDEIYGGSRFKTWAGQQKVTTIANAMLHSARSSNERDTDWFNDEMIARDDRGRIVEPFYFDARRLSHALDAGFSLDVQEFSTAAHPAVEVLCLIGLQRFRPHPTEGKWTFEYWSWMQPLNAPVAACAACGVVPIPGRCGYRFSLQFRDDQKRYKAFGYATPIGGEA